MLIFLLIPFFYIIAANPYQLNSKIMNVAFESRIELKSEEINNSPSLIDLLKTFFKKILTCSPNESKENQEKEIVFRAYLQQLGCVLKNLDDNDFKFVIDTAVKQLEKYYKDKKVVHPFLFNKKLKDYISGRMGIMTIDGDVDKAKVADVLEKNNKTLVDAEFFGLLSKIFSMEDLATFQIHLKTLSAYPKHKDKTKLSNAVKGFDFAIIEAYEKLDDEKKYQFDMALTDIFEKDDQTNKKHFCHKRHKTHRRASTDDNFGQDYRNSSEYVSNTIVETQTNVFKENKSRSNVGKQVSLVQTTSARHRPSCALSTGVTRPAKENLMELAMENVEVFNRKATDVSTSSAVPSTTAIFY